MKSDPFLKLKNKVHSVCSDDLACQHRPRRTAKVGILDANTLDYLKKHNQPRKGSGMSLLDRKLTRYRKKVEEVSCKSASLGLLYDQSILPGIDFYKFLTSRNNKPDNKKILRQNILQLWIPDTIIYAEKGPPLWIYSDKDGNIQCTFDFNDKHVLEKLGNRKYENDPVILCKEASVAPCSSTSKAMLYQGNNVRLLSSNDLKTLLSKLSTTPKNFALQKFIKCKGPSAFIVRVIMRSGKPAFAWKINNTIQYDDENEQSVVNRFCTVSSKPLSCSFVKITGKACDELYTLNNRLLKYCEAVLGRSIEFIAADYIKDDLGQWWFIQVKGFRFRGVPPGRSLGISSRIKHLYAGDQLSREQEEDMSSSDDEFQVKNKSFNHLSHLRVHKMYPCKSCQVLYPLSSLSYKMTLKMIHDTAARIKARVATEKSFDFLGSHSKDSGDSSSIYEPWSVCSLCYKLYEHEKKLIVIEKNFSRAIGVPLMDKTDKNSKQSFFVKEETINSYYQGILPSEFTLCRLTIFFTAVYDIPEEFFEVEKRQYDLSKLYPKKPYSKLYLKFTVLGLTFVIPFEGLPKAENNKGDNQGKSTYWIPINMMRTLHFFAPNTPLHAKLKDTNGLAVFLANAGGGGTILVQLIRSNNFDQVVAFNLPPKVKSTVLSKITSNKRKHGFLACSQPTTVSLGVARIPLVQFRSSYVSKTDIYSSMSAEGDKFNLKGNVALERIRLVKSQYILEKKKLRFCRGVYVLPVGYYCNDRLPEEWIESLPENEPKGLAMNGSKCIDDFEDDDNDLENILDCNDFVKERFLEPFQDAEQRLMDKYATNVAAEDDKSTKTQKLSSYFEIKPSNTKPKLSTSQPSRISAQIPELSTNDSIWCITIMMHCIHNLSLSANTGASWEASYKLFGQNRIVKQSFKENLHGSKDSSLVNFNSNDKFYIECSMKTLRQFMLKHRTEVILRRSSCEENILEYICNLEMQELQNCRAIDSTFDIVNKNGDSIRMENSEYPAYLSASIYVLQIGTKTQRSDVSSYTLCHVEFDNRIKVLKAR